MRAVTAFGLASTLLLSGCGSSPKTNFYALNIVPARAGRHAGSGHVQLAAVHVPPALDRQQMVRMSGENTVEISDTNRWSAAFDEMVRNVLAQDLMARFPAGALILPEAPAPPGTATLVVTLTRFGPDASGEVKLDGSWSLLNGASGAAVLDRDFHISSGAAPNADAMAAAMSQALGELADRMAATVSSH